MTSKKSLSETTIWVSKDGEFYDDFNSVKKFVQRAVTKKLEAKNC
jgi:hypothetical protein